MDPRAAITTIADGVAACSMMIDLAQRALRSLDRALTEGGEFGGDHDAALAALRRQTAAILAAELRRAAESENENSDERG